MGLELKFNAARLEANLRQVGDETLANGARSLRRVAERARDLAQSYAPVDDGDLENAIKIEKGFDDRRRVTYTVYVDGDAPAHSDDEGNIDKTVGDYALLQERNLTPSGAWQLGPRSAAKAAGGNKVGGAFMKRAVNKAAERAMQDLAESIRVMLRSRTGTGIGGRIMSERDYGVDE